MKEEISQKFSWTMTQTQRSDLSAFNIIYRLHSPHVFSVRFSEQGCWIGAQGWV